MIACTCIVLGLAATGLSSLAGSVFLSAFLDANLLLVLIALMAINTTTVSVILTKMKEIAQEHPGANFSATRKSMKQATLEQLALIVVAVLLQVAKTSPRVLSEVPSAKFILDALLVAVFAFALQILFDTAQGVYVILDSED